VRSSVHKRSASWGGPLSVVGPKNVCSGACSFKQDFKDGGSSKCEALGIGCLAQILEERLSKSLESALCAYHVRKGRFDLQPRGIGRSQLKIDHGGEERPQRTGS
jgi:hypothetical protein